jgi:hypothetical protein
MLAHGYPCLTGSAPFYDWSKDRYRLSVWRLCGFLPVAHRRHLVLDSARTRGTGESTSSGERKQIRQDVLFKEVVTPLTCLQDPFFATQHNPTIGYCSLHTIPSHGLHLPTHHSFYLHQFASAVLPPNPTPSSQPKVNDDWMCSRPIPPPFPKGHDWHRFSLWFHPILENNITFWTFKWQLLVFVALLAWQPPAT